MSVILADSQRTLGALPQYYRLGVPALLNVVIASNNNGANVTVFASFLGPDGNISAAFPISPYAVQKFRNVRAGGLFLTGSGANVSIIAMTAPDEPDILSVNIVTGISAAARSPIDPGLGSILQNRSVSNVPADNSDAIVPLVVAAGELWELQAVVASFKTSGLPGTVRTALLGIREGGPRPAGYDGVADDYRSPAISLAGGDFGSIVAAHDVVATQVNGAPTLFADSSILPFSHGPGTVAARITVNKQVGDRMSVIAYYRRTDVGVLPVGVT